ncbi:small conductance calcium-activated potassium channel protein 1-like [Schistocerca piceifrons]|uniref:small conductance calcium-activated potassium channel protein 1-like n=1 Tax=Schistocerca piceifrons TaxID=274613 RepID=UPI001F5E8F16|nr:small conductance calcium-activated potassium channel protein 1-like [Schistocerca piceifrons]
MDGIASCRVLPKDAIWDASIAGFTAPKIRTVLIETANGEFEVNGATKLKKGQPPSYIYGARIGLRAAHSEYTSALPRCYFKMFAIGLVLVCAPQPPPPPPPPPPLPWEAATWSHRPRQTPPAPAPPPLHPRWTASPLSPRSRATPSKFFFAFLFFFIQ